jgi:hypothetical protein
MNIKVQIRDFLCVTALAAISLFIKVAKAQLPATTAIAVQNPSRDLDAERVLTLEVQKEIRSQGGIIWRIRRPDVWALQLTCSVAADPAETKSADALGLFVMRAAPLESPELIKHIARAVKATNEVPYASVLVFISKDADGKRIVTVAIEQRESKWNRFKGCLFTEDGCNDDTWRKTVVPGCRGVRS